MSERFKLVSVSYPTIPDYLRYVERYPSLMSRNIDLKDVQRPWALETVSNYVKPGARVLDMGGAAAELAASLMATYDVTIVDPYAGHGSGPTNVRILRAKYPKVTFIQGLLTRDLNIPRQNAIVSTSVVEHISPSDHAACVDAIYDKLDFGGYSIHAIDLTCKGVNKFLESQIELNQSWMDAHCSGYNVPELTKRILDDIEAFFLPVSTYLQWKKDRPYTKYPWRKVSSLQAVFQKIA